MVIAIAVLFAVARCCHAQDCQGESGATAHTLGGSEGIWFPTKSARCLMSQSVGAMSCNTLLGHHLRKVDQQDKKYGYLKQSYALAETQITEQSIQIDRLSDALDDAEGWYTRGAIWLVVGFVVGVAGTSAVAIATK